METTIGLVRRARLWPPSPVKHGCCGVIIHKPSVSGSLACVICIIVLCCAVSWKAEQHQKSLPRNQAQVQRDEVNRNLGDCLKSCKRTRRHHSSKNLFPGEEGRSPSAVLAKLPSPPKPCHFRASASRSGIASPACKSLPVSTDLSALQCCIL